MSLEEAEKSMVLNALQTSWMEPDARGRAALDYP